MLKYINIYLQFKKLLLGSEAGMAVLDPFYPDKSTNNGQPL